MPKEYKKNLTITPKVIDAFHSGFLNAIKQTRKKLENENLTDDEIENELKDAYAKVAFKVAEDISKSCRIPIKWSNSDKKIIIDPDAILEQNDETKKAQNSLIIALNEFNEKISEFADEEFKSAKGINGLKKLEELNKLTKHTTKKTLIKYTKLFCYILTVIAAAITFSSLALASPAIVAPLIVALPAFTTIEAGAGLLLSSILTYGMYSADKKLTSREEELQNYKSSYETSMDVAKLSNDKSPTKVDDLEPHIIIQENLQAVRIVDKAKTILKKTQEKITKECSSLLSPETEGIITKILKLIGFNKSAALSQEKEKPKHVFNATVLNSSQTPRSLH